MEFSVMNIDEKNDGEINKPAEKTQEGSACVSADGGGRATPRRFDPGVRITEGMMWHPREKPTSHKLRNQRPYTGPTWGHLFRQIIVGVIEILIPLAFIVGMIYWRAPWLYWAVVHFVRGEPILHL